MLLLHAPIRSCTKLGTTIPMRAVPQPHAATRPSGPLFSWGGCAKRRGEEESGRTSASIKNVWGGKLGEKKGARDRLEGNKTREEDKQSQKEKCPLFS